MIKDINYLFQIVRNASKDSEKSELVTKALKLNEEVGELAAEVLKDCGYKKSSLNKREIRERIIEEGVDSLVMIIDILNSIDATDSEMIIAAENAVNKWLINNKTK